MHRRSTSCKILILIVGSCFGDWVEIPYLQPSTTTQKTTIIRKNINRPPFVVESGFMSHVLPPFSIDGDRDSEESEEEDGAAQSPINHATLSPPVGISSLVDFEEFRRRSTTTTESPFSGFPEKYSNFQKRIYEYPQVNVSSKLGWTSPTDELHFAVSDSDRIATSHPKSDRHPMTNKYQEESIEYLHGVASGSTLHRPPHQIVSDRVEIPVDSSSEESGRPPNGSSSSEENDRNRTTEVLGDKDRFHDFDDYDELHPGGMFGNVTVVKRRRRPGPPPPGQRVTIVKVFPPRRHLRPTADPGNDGGGFSGFVSFLKRMQDRFMQRTAKNIGDKIKILQDLKDQLLLSIERKMSTLWRDRNRGNENDQKMDGNRRVKRGGGGWMEYGDSGHGGMDFPSAEAALLTISFLTFAVFLIKLVLQVINTIKSKHYTYNTLAGMNGLSGATLKIVNRSKRSSDTSVEEDHWKHNLDILSAINSYKFS